MAIGAAPPVRKRTRHPWIGTSVAEMRPGSAPPKAMPVNITMIIVARTRRGANSPFRAMILGSSPPIPMPARNRRHISSVTEPALLQASVKAPKVTLEAITAILRP